MTQKTGRRYPAVPQTKPYEFDGPAPGHDGKRPVIVRVVDRQAEDGSSTTVEWNKNHCKLCFLEHRKSVTPLQLEAGHRLQNDQYLTGIDCYPSTLAALLTARGGGMGDALQTKLDAKTRLEQALMAVPTKGRFLLIHVVLKDMDVRVVAKLLRDKRGRALHVSAVVPLLGDALDLLARHYELAGSAPDRGELRAWLHPFDASI